MAGYVQHAVAEDFSPTSPATVSLTGTDGGNGIVLIAANQGTEPLSFTGVTDSVNTYSPCVGASCNSNTVASGTQMATFFAPNVAGGSVTLSVAWTGSSGAIGLYAFEVSGVNAYDNGGGDVQPTGATADAGTFLTKYTPEIILAATIQPGSALSQGTGFTLIEITATFNDLLQYAIVPAGSQSPTGNLNGSQAWGMVAAAFYKIPPPPTAMIVSAAGCGW